MAEPKENRKYFSNHNRANNNEKSCGPNGERNYYRKGVNQFKGKFEGDDTHNSFCLTACGCFERHNLSREEQYLTDEENRRGNFAMFNTSEFKERQLVNMAAFLQKQGCSLRLEETLEQYVQRNKNKLNEEHIQTLERSMEP